MGEPVNRAPVSADYLLHSVRCLKLDIAEYKWALDATGANPDGVISTCAKAEDALADLARALEESST